MNRDLSRQTFLGAESDATLARLRVAIIGLCGGGSHVAQQLAHIGVREFMLCDPDIVEDSNLNRMVGATRADVEKSRPKVDVIADRITAVDPNAKIVRCVAPWQSHHLQMRGVHAVFGCVDTFSDRAQLEAMCRRFLIPYIDVGMEVSKTTLGHAVSGQIIMSIPGRPCMRCMGFITDSLLAAEAGQYGAAGARPQVVWPNGVLASTAIGMFMTLVLPWQGNAEVALFMEYDGNSHRVFASNRIPVMSKIICRHYSDPGNLGDPFYGEPLPLVSVNS